MVATLDTGQRSHPGGWAGEHLASTCSLEVELCREEQWQWCHPDTGSQSLVSSQSFCAGLSSSSCRQYVSRVPD